MVHVRLATHRPSAVAPAPSASNAVKSVDTRTLLPRKNQDLGACGSVFWALEVVD